MTLLLAWGIAALLYTLGALLMLTVASQGDSRAIAVLKCIFWPFVVVWAVPLAIFKPKDIPNRPLNY